MEDYLGELLLWIQNTISMFNLEMLMQLLNDLELRIVMALSLIVQVFLWVHSIRRLQTKNKWFHNIASVACFLGDWIAGVGLGLMFRGHYGNNTSPILAMWAPFLLLHLGGTNALNSFSVEDEYLWLKKSGCLLLNSFLTIFIIIKIPLNMLLIILTVLAFLAAVLKNILLIRSLLFQKNELFKDLVETQPEDLPEVLEVIHGPTLYEIFLKAFIKKRKLSSQLRRKSTSYFRETSAPRAFSLLESEFFAMYRAFYLTKYGHCDLINFGFKILLVIGVIPIGNVSNLARLQFQRLDYDFTQWLILSIMLQSFSYLLEGFGIPFLGEDPAWSESMCVMNLVDLSLPHRSTSKIAEYAADVGLEDVVRIIRLHLSVSVVKLDNDFKRKIFVEMQRKSRSATDKETAFKIGYRSGDGALKDNSRYVELKWTLKDRYCDYGQRIILWNVATDLCVAQDLSKGRHLKNDPVFDFSKTISDYMLYLIIMETKMMAPVVGKSESAFNDTCREASKLFRDNSIRGRAEACSEILRYGRNGAAEEGTEASTQILSVLGDAIPLANRLLGHEFTYESRWKLVSEVWIEFLSYAAFQSEPRIHVEQPGQGGELLSFVWLLMNHLGIGKQFWEEDAAKPLIDLN